MLYELIGDLPVVSNMDKMLPKFHSGTLRNYGYYETNVAYLNYHLTPIVLELVLNGLK